MKKLILLLFVFSTSLLNKCCAQTWDSLTGRLNGYAACMTVYNGNLYVGGGFTKAGSITVNGIACWNGTSWSALGGGVTSANNPGYVWALCVYNNKLYAAGFFDSAGGSYVSNIASWDGTSWAPVDHGIVSAYLFYGVNTLCVYNNNLYAGGFFDSAGGVPVNNMAMYNGTVWSSVSSGVNAGVECMAVYNNKLCVGGYFDSAGGVSANEIAAWDGATWTNLGSGVRTNEVRAAIAYNGSLYVAGDFDSAGNVAAHGVASWNGSQWYTGNISTYGTALGIWGNTLCLGSLEGNNNLWWLNGANWRPLGRLERDTIIITALCEYNGSFYATGNFDSVNGICAPNIAKCSGVLGVTEVNTAKAEVSVYPNPSSGTFTFQMNNEKLKMNSVVEVYNMLGEKIYTQTFNTQNLTFNLGSQPAGVYMYRVITQTGTMVGSGKLEIQ